MLTSKQHIINRKIIIMQSGMTQARLARKIGITYMGLYKAMNGITKNPQMHKRICDALGVTKEQFWPEFYGDDRGNAVRHDATVAVEASAVNHSREEVINAES
jgi:lambda repressor-like predicted transcriptional regulator